MITNINEILIEWAYRTRDGLPDPKSMSHQIILEGILREFGWNIEQRGELLKNLQEAKSKKSAEDEKYFGLGGNSYILKKDKPKDYKPGDDLTGIQKFSKDKDSGEYSPVGEKPAGGEDGVEKPKGADLGYSRDGDAADGATDADGEGDGTGEDGKAKDLANDPDADVGPDSRGVKWDASYEGAEDSTEWEKHYREAEKSGDEKALEQIKWFGEKQGWGEDGELGKSEKQKEKEEKEERAAARKEADKKDNERREEERKKSKDPRKSTHLQKHLDDLNDEKDELEKQIKKETDPEKLALLKEKLKHINARIKKKTGLLAKEKKKEKEVKKLMENPSDIGSSGLTKEQREIRNSIDAYEINYDENGNPRTPEQRHEKLLEKLEKRREEIYLGKDLPAGTPGSTTGEMGGGMAAEDITNDMEVDDQGNVKLYWDGEEVTEEEYEKRWMARERERIREAKGLEKKICGKKKGAACDELVNEWLKVAYRTGRNEVHQLITNPDYNAEIPQPEGMPTGHVMDYNNQALVRNELEQRRKECDELKDSTKEGGGERYEKCAAHYDRQLKKLEGLKETDTGVLYMDKNGNLRFKHTSNKKSEKDPHYNKSIQSKKASMQEAAVRQREACKKLSDKTKRDECVKKIDDGLAVIEKTSDKGSQTVYDGDRVVGADVRGLDDELGRESLKGGSSLLGKLPSRSATKGDDYAGKVRKRGDDYKKLHDECLEIYGPPASSWTDEMIMEAQLRLMEKGDRVTKPTDDVKKIEEAGEGVVVDLGDGKYGKLIDGVPRACDKDGNPDFSVTSAKLLYKLSELIDTMRNKAREDSPKPPKWGKNADGSSRDPVGPWPPGYEDWTDADYEKFGQLYDPNLTAEEVKWILHSDGADAIADSNNKRKVANDKAHEDVVKDIQDSDASITDADGNPVFTPKPPPDGHITDGEGNNGPATQLYVDSFMEDMHWNRYIDGDHDGVGDMSINGQNVQPKHFRECLAKLSGHIKQEEGESDEEFAERVEEHFKDPANREALKQHLRNKVRISASRGEGASTTDPATSESRDAHISFDSDTVPEVPDKRQGKKEGETRPVSVGEERYRSKGVGVNSVVGGLGLDMQECILKKMNQKGSNAVGAAE